MRDFGYEPIPQVFTALFNACSKSIYGKEDGFQRATKLIYTMKANNITPTQITFNAMIKTFGCLGQTEIALHLADQSFKLYKPDDKTFANILMAAAGDEKNGFSLAIGVAVYFGVFLINFFHMIFHFFCKFYHLYPSICLLLCMSLNVYIFDFSLFQSNMAPLVKTF